MILHKVVIGAGLKGNVGIGNTAIICDTAISQWEREHKRIQHCSRVVLLVGCSSVGLRSSSQPLGSCGESVCIPQHKHIVPGVGQEGVGRVWSRGWGWGGLSEGGAGHMFSVMYLRLT